MEYITVKIPRKAMPIITELQAHETLAEGRRVTQGEVVLEALEERKNRRLATEKKKYTFNDFIGSIKGGKKSNATKEIDDLLYGPMKTQ